MAEHEIQPHAELAQRTACHVGPCLGHGPLMNFTKAIAPASRRPHVTLEINVKQSST